MITAQKIEVYDEFGGDEDGLLRVGLKHQKKLFEANDHWFQIMNFYQDIGLINNQLASADYIKNAISAMRKYCDADAYQILMSKIINH